jgi:hypothetical protein
MVMIKEQTVYLIFNNDEYKAYAKQNDIISANSLSNADFKKLSETFGKNYSLEEFEMFWNTGKIPAFCFIRVIPDEQTV